MTAVLLMAFGGPETLDEVAPFMARLTGRAPEPAVLERVVERYRIIGGGSPLPLIVRQQANALEHRLMGEDVAVAVQVAFKYSQPLITQVVRQLAEAGVTRIIGLSTSPHYSQVTTGGYLAEAKAAADANGLAFTAGAPYYAEPHFVNGLAANAKAAISLLADTSATDLVFSAHSLPVDYVAKGDPYVEELRATCEGVAALLPGYRWRLAYQSKGFGRGEWLGPMVEDVLEELARADRRAVVVVPVGFTADHVETLYDIDVSIAEKARALRLAFQRAKALNTSEEYIEALASAARAALSNG